MRDLVAAGLAAVDVQGADVGPGHRDAMFVDERSAQRLARDQLSEGADEESMNPAAISHVWQERTGNAIGSIEHLAWPAGGNGRGQAFERRQALPFDELHVLAQIHERVAKSFGPFAISRGKEFELSDL